MGLTGNMGIRLEEEEEKEDRKLAQRHFDLNRFLRESVPYGGPCSCLFEAVQTAAINHFAMEQDCGGAQTRCMHITISPT